MARWAILRHIISGLLLIIPLSSLAELTVGDLELVSYERVSRVEYEFVYKTTVTNSGDAVRDVVATVTSSSPYTTIIEGGLEFGDLDGGATTGASDTFTIRHNRTVAFDPAVLVWDIQSTPVEPDLLPGTDDDFDGVANSLDNCPLDYNPEQKDVDQDHIGDACDSYVPIADSSHPYGVVTAELRDGSIFYKGSLVEDPKIVTGSLAQDFPIFDYDGPGIGTNRDCTFDFIDCTPTRDCTFDFIDCTPTTDCSGDKIDCAQTNVCGCFVSVFGTCILRDPVCEAAKVTAKGSCELGREYFKKRCEVIKSADKFLCEAKKSGRKLNCEEIKTTEKFFCETDKSAKKVDCERLKLFQMAAGEIGEVFIQESRRQAKKRDPQPIPPFIRSALEKFFDPAMLDSVRWTFGTGNIADTAVKLAFDLGARGAITLDDVIVFKTELGALYDIGLWAHELEHVNQYKLLGIDHFAEYYTDYWIEEFVARAIFLRSPFVSNSDPTPRDVNEYAAKEFNKIEALATVQSVYVCDKIDPGRSYNYKAGILDSAGRVIKQDPTLCIPR